VIELKGTSWQQRYSMPEIFTFRCKILDKPEIFAKLSECIGSCGCHLGDIKLIDIDRDHLIRDVTVYLKSKGDVAGLSEAINSIDGLEVLSVCDETLETHRRGSIEIYSKMPIRTLTDLRMVYTPGVAGACNAIVDQEQAAWDYTGICNRVAIATNGTAVLGIGDIGVLASLPVMEGKASIFAEFVGISAFPVLIDTKDPDEFVETMIRISKGFGAVQLEDVAAPACFEIEEKLRERLNIPVFHDDQHGTATIVLAALINAIKQTGRKVEDSSVVMLGAGAAGIAISKILLKFGVSDIVVYDSTGPLYRGREEKMNKYKRQLAEITNKDNVKGTLLEGFKGRDIFIGVSRPNMVSMEMVSSMAKDPIVLPLSNPIGEISKEQAYQAGAAIAADGRDINNALAYPAIFRGALDAKATQINLTMQMACAKRLAELAPQGTLLPDILNREVHMHAAKAVAESVRNPK